MNQARARVPLQRSVVYNGLRDGHGCYLIVAFGTANADKVINHPLGRTPVGYNVIRRPVGGGQVTDGSGAGADWTSATITLQSTTASTFTLFVF